MSLVYLNLHCTYKKKIIINLHCDFAVLGLVFQKCLQSETLGLSFVLGVI